MTTFENSSPTPYIERIVNNRKEVIQCLIASQTRPGSLVSKRGSFSNGLDLG